MQAISYANEGDVTPKNSYNPSLAPENLIGLLPEHIVFIDKTLRRQIAKISFTSYELRILIVIHDQTLGYDKFEDDMNGTRLCQLTGIRNDHANQAVRSLEANNVIITRRGHYGKWMSINFDLNHWLKQHCDTQSNDPRILLPAYYQDTPIDAGLPLSRPVFEATPETHVITEVVTTKKPATKKPVIEKIMTEKPIIEKIIAKKPATKKPIIAKPVTEIPIEVSEDSHHTPINIPISCLNNSHSDEKTPAPTPAKKETPESGTTSNKYIKTTTKQTGAAPLVEEKIPAIVNSSVELKKPTETNKPIEISKPIKAIEPKETEETEEIKNTVFVFEYPVSTPESMRNKMAVWLNKISNPQDAQKVLNYFAQCLLNNAVRKPFVYFVSLVRSFLKGELFLSEGDKHSPQQQAVARKVNQQEEEKKRVYQDALDDYQHRKNAILREAKKANASFEEYLATSFVDQLVWQQVVDKLDEVTP